MTNEKTFKPFGGYLPLFLILATIGASVYLIIDFQYLFMIAAIILSVFCLPGFFVINPNEAMVMVFFGTYKGTVKSNGFFWANPFFSKKKVSLKARNFDSEPIKVNDKTGNPIMIGVVLVWRVENTYKAAFEVDHYEHFVTVQSESALRNLAGSYSYDNFDDDEQDITLRSGGEEVNDKLEHMIRERLMIAGISVIEARINYIAYAQEIAGAMLQKQQAIAVVAARQKIVEGAVGMVEMALAQLSEKKIIDLDDERKAAMVTNLMVVLCSDKSATPVVNAGTLHH